MSIADRRTLYDAALAAAADGHERMRQQDPAPLMAAADAVLASLRAGGKLLVFGNGGSAADAQHVATELVGRFVKERKGIAAIALSADPVVLTALGNDYGFERVFARQVEALGAKGDVALAISTSGRSPNVLAAVEAAKAAGLTTIGLTGHDGGALGRAVDIHVNVPATATPRIQEVQMTLLHILCEWIEGEL
jgi:phosphoheptose isomerase